MSNNSNNSFNNFFSKKNNNNLKLNEQQTPPNSKKNVFFVILLLSFVIFSIYLLKDLNQGQHQVNFSNFLNLIEDENIKWEIIEISNSNVTAVFSLKVDNLDKNRLLFYQSKYKYLQIRNAKNDIYKITTYSPAPLDLNFIQLLYDKGIPFKSEVPSNNYLLNLLLSILPWIIIFGFFWFFMFRQIQGSGNKAISFGKSKARIMLPPNQKRVTFQDVAGVDEAKEDLIETVEFLKTPEKFRKLGARIPKGILLIGPPGTGKTLLAKSVAGESNRPFFSISGSEFVEMFVGVGASRVRDLFEQGKKHAPCIIFIDELDAVGRVRGSGYGGGHDEREQTLNQMLVEMDGFNTNETVIIMAATNRPDVLDPALLRPGRFDRQVFVHKPSVEGRKAILNIHLKKIVQDDNINVDILARGTPGFSGADLENLVNEATILAGRENKSKVEMPHFEYAKDKILMGPETKSIGMSVREKENTAYHESGHALLAYLLPESNALHKVSIIPRGRALGVTQTLPQEEKFTMSKKSIIQEIMVLFGGRIAEIYKFGEDYVTNGSSNDIEKATQLARSMVIEWGMGNENTGPISYDFNSSYPSKMLYSQEKTKLSQKMLEQIDLNIKTIMDHAYSSAKNLIYNNIDKLELLATVLFKKEILSKEDIEDLFNDKLNSDSLELIEEKKTSMENLHENV